MLAPWHQGGRALQWLGHEHGHHRKRLCTVHQVEQLKSAIRVLDMNQMDQLEQLHGKSRREVGRYYGPTPRLEWAQRRNIIFL